jgi:hypothetical protein
LLWRFCRLRFALEFASRCVLSRRLRSRLPLACELLRRDDLRRGHFRSDHIAFFDIFVAIFFIQNHDVRKRPDNQRLLPSAADSGTRAALRASRFALRRCRSAFSACFRRSVCRDIRALVSGIVSREEGYAQGVVGGPQGCGSVSVSGKRDFGGRDNGVETVRHIQPIVSRDKRPHENPPVRRYLHDTGKSLFA